MEFLCDYYLKVKYIQGKENVVADALSHRRHGVSTLSLSVDLRSRFISALPSDAWYQEVNTDIALESPLEGRYTCYSLNSNGLLRHLGHINVPP